MWAQNLLILCIVITTVGIKLGEAVFWAQAKFGLTDNIKFVAVFVEEKTFEVEMAILGTKVDLNDVGSANCVLKICHNFCRIFKNFQKFYLDEIEGIAPGCYVIVLMN